MTPSNKDYSPKGRLAAVALVAVLILGSFIPPVTLGGVELRRANILSELLTFDDLTEETREEAELFNEEDFKIDLEEVSKKIEEEVEETPAEDLVTVFRWQADPSFQPERTLPRLKEFKTEHTPTPIEDFSADHRMEAFYDTLLHARRPVRIAVLGDSFIEGDILTCDLRERLQGEYGGGGTGFAPFSSPLTSFRRTIRTRSNGWSAHNIMQYQKTPENLRDHFFVSGWVCKPDADASTRWEMTSIKRHLDACNTARIYFKSRNNTRVCLTLNDTLHHIVEVKGDDAVREIEVSSPRIASLAVSLDGGHEGFIGYGAVFENQGVVVDNYSVRSNNGHAMFRTNPAVNAQINAFAPYDLVILQYGLNIMQQGVHSYTNYAAQIEKMVAYVRKCFPQAAILVMGVSDRSVKGADGYEPMDAIPSMLKHQLQAAQNTGAAFWPTATAMREKGGMARFVANGWAGKDFTHINFAGGRQVALSLADALDEGVNATYERIFVERRRERARQMRIDSLENKIPQGEIPLPDLRTSLKQ